MAPPEAHLALFYRDSEEYLAGISSFVMSALAAGEPVAIAVPGPEKVDLVREAIDGHAGDVELLDMVELGGNPGRIIAAVQGMIERREGRLHYIGEPIWPGRSPEEIREATRHEALVNQAWSAEEVRVLCPYDAAGLDEAILRDAERTHPGLVRDGRATASPSYRGPVPPAGCEAPLPDPPTDSVSLPVEAAELGHIRTLVAEQAVMAGLGRERAAEFVLAVNELTTNSVKHAGAGGTLHVWSEPGEVICQVQDGGRIADPLAGRRRGVPGTGGLGLWIVNQLCDLVEVRTHTAGSTVRVRARGAPPGCAGASPA
jgi:anti-sigma regulatory factor (Ser/Thr protein kinase)